MLEIAIPGAETLRLEHLVADYNGTLARDGRLLPGVSEAFASLAGRLDLHVVTADTHGGARAALAGLPCRLTILPAGAQDEAKRDFVEALGAARCVVLGNGRNDRLMLAAAGLGIAVIEAEGVAVATLQAARVAVFGIDAALGLLLNPARLVATLRV